MAICRKAYALNAVRKNFGHTVKAHGFYFAAAKTTAAKPSTSGSDTNTCLKTSPNAIRQRKMTQTPAPEPISVMTGALIPACWQAGTHRNKCVWKMAAQPNPSGSKSMMIATGARLIDAKDIRRNKGKKAKIVNPYKGECWQPPSQEINDGDKVWITEGIFKSIALLESKFEKEAIKTVSALSANNLPIEFIKRNADRNITWVIALDNDPAGISSSIKFKEQIKELKERVLIAIPAGKSDWDDEFRLKRLNDKYFKKALWHGQYLTATTAKEKAFWLYVKTGFNHTVIEQNHQIWRSALRDRKDANAMSEFKERYHGNKEPLYTDALHDVESAINLFSLDYSTTAISNCLPRFLYTEINPQTDEKHYFFKVTFPNRKGQYLAGLSASDLDSPANFKRSLLSKVTGARIRPAPTDLDILQEHWFDHGTGPGRDPHYSLCGLRPRNRSLCLS